MSSDTVSASLTSASRRRVENTLHAAVDRRVSIALRALRQHLFDEPAVLEKEGTVLGGKKTRHQALCRGPIVEQESDRVVFDHPLGMFVREARLARRPDILQEPLLRLGQSLSEPRAILARHLNQ